MRNVNLKSRRALGCLGRLAAGVMTVAVLALSAPAADPFDKKEKENKGTAPGGAAENSSETEHPLTNALKVARESQKALEGVKDYRANFYKKEMVRRTMIPHDMQIKFRAEPFSVYLKFLRTHQGREVLYVAGKNNGKLMAHEGSGIKSIVGTLSLVPTSREAMAEGRYPITEIGMHKMLDGVVRQWEVESKFGEIKVDHYEEAELETTAGKVKCDAFVSQHPQPRNEFKFQKTVLYIDKATRYPVRVEQYDFPQKPGGEPLLVEEYTYSNIEANVDLTDRDFDPKNPQYKF
jgi:hypothetical protein